MSQSRRQPREDRRDPQVHAAIIEAASELVIERSYRDVTVEAIAARAGVGKQTIYRWWPSKADLFLEIYLTLAHKDVLVTDTGDARRDLQSFLQRLFDIYRDTAAAQILAGLIMESRANARVANAIRTRLIVERRDLPGHILRLGIARGQIRPDIAPDLVFDIVSGVIWFRLLMGHAPLDENAAAALAAHLVDGMASP